MAVTGTASAGATRRMLPPELRGAWERTAFSVGHRPVERAARVLWVQASESFADLRIPRGGDRLECFAGTTSWDGESLTWRHTHDLAGWEGADTGRVSWRDGDLVETGEMVVDGRSLPYEEVWRRVDDGSELLVLRAHGPDGAPLGLLVATGRHALTVVDPRPAGTFAAASWRRRTSGWVARDLVGVGAGSLPGPPADIPPPGAEAHLAWWAGCDHWTVVEHRSAS